MDKNFALKNKNLLKNLYNTHLDLGDLYLKTKRIGNAIFHYHSALTINKNSNAYNNYKILMKTSVKLLKKNFKKILNYRYKTRKQKLANGSYYSRDSVNYEKMKYFNLTKLNMKHFNRIKAFIFPPLQLPLLNNIKISINQTS